MKILSCSRHSMTVGLNILGMIFLGWVMVKLTNNNKMTMHNPLLGSHPGTPKAPLTPRTLQLKKIWWLAAASLVMSTFAAVHSTLTHSSGMFDADSGPTPMRQVVMKSFLLTPQKSKLLYQSKPLLVAEEELTAEDIATLNHEQTSKEFQTLKHLSNAEESRAAVVRELVAEFPASKPISKESLEEIHRQFARYSITEEDLVRHQPESESSFPKVKHTGEYKNDGEFFAEELVAEFKLEELDEEGEDEGADDDYFSKGHAGRPAPVPSLPKEEVVEVQQPAETIKPEKTHPLETQQQQPAVAEKATADEGQQQPAQGGASSGASDAATAARSDGPSFLDVLSTCDSLECLRSAHSRKREPGQFNFPHALLLGWQKSATTSLYKYLESHPQGLPSAIKEPEFFTLDCKTDPNHGCPPSKQSSYIEDTLQRDRFIASGGQLMAYEASTHYAMNGDVLASGIKTAMPWVKVVASLREPISRAASMLVHMLDEEKAGCLMEPEADLFTCLVTDSQLLGHAGPFNNLDSPYGNYSYELAQWLKSFPKGQMHVLQYETLVEGGDASKAALRGLKQFLDLDPSQPAGHSLLSRRNSRKDVINPDGWPMRREQYDELVTWVRTDAEKVAKLVEKHGFGIRREWLAKWEKVWDDNLAQCSVDGNCLIQLS